VNPIPNPDPNPTQAPQCTMECGGERQAHISHSHDSDYGRLGFNALQQRHHVSGPGAFIRRSAFRQTGSVEHEPSSTRFKFSLV
jgi:hypothetical protein